MIEDPEFVSKYMQRLKLDPSFVLDEKGASIEKLQCIQEAHLAQIPFENLAQHGCLYPATVLDIQQTANKILNKNRGGFCFELNGLLAELLIKLGYTVGRVPASVCFDEVNFRDVETHLVLIVACNTNQPNERSSLWFVDVGFGEPSIHPLQYDERSFDLTQVTPEGMQSKISKIDGDVILYWWSYQSRKWLPRLKWNYDASLLLGLKSPPLAAFVNNLAAVHDEASIFSQKLICCRLTREMKYTVAGNRYKVTGKPRFNMDQAVESACTGPVPPVAIRLLESEDELRNALRNNFDIPMEATDGIGLKKSLTADPIIWSQH
jgi:N-hydroxyarylamine O-acetyltransferase